MKSTLNIITLFLTCFTVTTFAWSKTPARAVHGETQTRVQITEALNMLEKVRVYLSEYIYDHGKAPASLSVLGKLPEGKYTRVIKISGNKLVATMKTTAHHAIADKTIHLEFVIKSKNQVNWRCRTGTIDNTYVPGACRK